MTALPEIESVYRLSLGTNDRLAVMVKGDVTKEQVEVLRKTITGWLDASVGQVAIFANGIELAVITQEQA